MKEIKWSDKNSYKELKSVETPKPLLMALLKWKYENELNLTLNN